MKHNELEVLDLNDRFYAEQRRGKLVSVVKIRFLFSVVPLLSALPGCINGV